MIISAPLRTGSGEAGLRNIAPGGVQSPITSAAFDGAPRPSDESWKIDSVRINLTFSVQETALEETKLEETEKKRYLTEGERAEAIAGKEGLHTDSLAVTGISAGGSYVVTERKLIKVEEEPERQVTFRYEVRTARSFFPNPIQVIVRIESEDGILWSTAISVNITNFSLKSGFLPFALTFGGTQSIEQFTDIVNAIDVPQGTALKVSLLMAAGSNQNIFTTIVGTGSVTAHVTVEP